MLTYYKRSGIWVTDQWIRVGDRRYPTAGIRRLEVARGPANASARNMGAFAGLLLPTAGGLAHQGLLAATAWTLAIGLLATAGALTMARLRPRSHQLWIDCQGRDVLINADPNGHELGKLTRAVTRALNSHSERAAVW